MKVSFLHLAPLAGEINRNREFVCAALTEAARSGADWIITPELCVCGYGFAETAGTDWILPQPDNWMREICRLTGAMRVTLFLSHPERDPQTGKLYNSMFALGPDGAILGKHRKINVLPGSESWSSPGDDAVPIFVGGLQVGLLICADVCTRGITNCLKERGAQVLVSAASWGPGPYQPNGEWEQCTLETQLPLFVCNRTGVDSKLSFDGATSVVVHDGARLLTFHSNQAAVVTFEWDPRSNKLVDPEWKVTYL